VIKSNENELRNTSDGLCTNPCGFDNGVLMCNEFGRGNPRLGLVMRDVNVLNQFALIYLNFGVENTNTHHYFSQNVSIDLYSMDLKKSDSGSDKFVLKQLIGNRKI
jgi:hypothetical protein